MFLGKKFRNSLLPKAYRFSTRFSGRCLDSFPILKILHSVSGIYKHFFDSLFVNHSRWVLKSGAFHGTPLSRKGLHVRKSDPGIETSREFSTRYPYARIPFISTCTGNGRGLLCQIQSTPLVCGRVGVKQNDINSGLTQCMEHYHVHNTTYEVLDG